MILSNIRLKRLIYFLGFVILLFTVILQIGCNKNKSDPEERPPDNGEIADSLKILPEGSKAYLISITPSIKFQQMDNFGASDCWSAQFVGKWPTSKTNQIADWLFSMDTTNHGQPLGIGLSAWRFNIGAGSASQGTNSGISDEWRRSECFLQANGTYNWNRQLGQQWFLKAANERGVNQFIGFANSPPVYMTKNGKAFGSKSDKENIAENKLGDFASFLVDVVHGIRTNTGIELTLLSPSNESQWDWTSGSQEGCYLRNNTYRKLVGELDLKLSDFNTNILISETGEWPYLYTNGLETGRQVDYFYGEDSPVKDAPNLSRTISGHSYYTTTPASKLVDIREKVWNKVSSNSDLRVWSSEYCPLGNGDLQALGWESWHRDLSMDVALYVSKVIYHDLVYARVSAWQWWLAISPYDYPDGLVYVSKDKTNGTYSDSKLMWTLGNFSRFVRPGAVRVKTISETSKVYAISFAQESDNSLIVVLINPDEDAQPVKLQVAGSTSNDLRPYITSNMENHKLFPMKSINLSNAFEMPPRSVITFTMKNLSIP